VLREKWPLAFPVEDHDVRPLAIGTAREITVAMGWPLPYTLGVLVSWKMAPVYCQAVLCRDQRIALDGAPAEAVDAEAKDLVAGAARGAGREKSGEGSGAHRGEADACPRAANRNAGAIGARVRAALLRRSA
jgi:ProQ/FINO family